MEAKSMGMFKVRARVANPSDPSRFFEEDFWVDTGSMYTFIPEDRLLEIGIEPLHNRKIISSGGKHERRLIGATLVTFPEFNGTLSSLVVFASTNSSYIIGTLTLDTFSVEPDPVTKKLKRVPAIIGAHFDSR